MVDTRVTFGFETLQTLYDSQIAKKEDVLILFVHWYLLKNGFKCLGLGDSKSYNSSEEGSELLPEGWNTRPDYALRYVNNQKLFILHGVKSDEDLLLNFLKVDDHSVSNVQFPINQSVNSLHGSLESLIPTYRTILQSLGQNLMQPVLPSRSREISTQTLTEDRSTPPELNTDPLRVGPSRPSLRPPVRIPERDPLRVGAADLDPFARGGGMIFDPFGGSIMDPRRPNIGGGRLPPMAIPPYARFDPFGPPDNEFPRPQGSRGSDDFFPPGGDDMFM